MKNDIKKNGSGYYDPTAFEAIINAGGVNNMEVYKGDIFYIEKGKTGEKSPAVVVSATEVIEETGCAQVAWLTNKEENSSSTHAKVMCMTPSVAICEKLSFAYLDRFGEYIRTCTEKEIQDIDNAMLATFGIERQNDNADCEEIRTLKEELSEQTAAESEDLIRALAEHNRRPAPLETGWKKQMYNQFMKGAGR